MGSNLVPALIMGVAAVFAATIAVYVTHSRWQAHGSKTFSLLMLGVMVWVAGAGLEAGLPAPATKILAAKLSYFGIVSVPPLWLVFAMRYVRHDRWVTRRFLAALAIVPVVTLVLVLTTESHGLVWRSTALNETSGTMVYEHGWWFWIWTGFAYGAIMIGTLMVLALGVRGRAVYRRQGIAIGVGAIIPWISNLIYLTGNSPWPGVDPAPLAFTVVGAIVAWALARCGLFDLTPIARDVLVGNLSDAVLVIDPVGRLVDMNPAASRLFGMGGAHVGLQVEQVLGDWPAMKEFFECRDREKAEVRLRTLADGTGASPSDERYMEVQSTVLHDGVGGMLGCLVVLHDVTARTLAQAVLKESEEALVRDIRERERLERENERLLEDARRRAAEADTLRQAAAAVAASLQLDTAIDRILDEVKRVVPYDAGAVWLVSGDLLVALGMRGPGIERLSRSRAERERDGGWHDWLRGGADAVTVAASLLEGPTREVVERRRPVLIGELGPQTALIPGSPTKGMSSWLGVPLVVHDRLIGLMELANIQAARFGTDEAQMAEAFADQVAVALENARLFEETQRLAVTDPLTAVHSRRYFFDQGEKEFARARRYPPKDLSAIMLDIDHFKLINDRFGHATGDVVLKEIARLCRDELRTVDIFARMGGEEFAALLPETDLSGAFLTAERLRARIESLEAEGIPHTTVSIGIAEATPECAGVGMLLTWCDRALYGAKEQGRNRVNAFTLRDNVQPDFV